MRSEVRSLPEPFLERLQRIFPRSRWDVLANTFTKKRPTTFRINTLKAQDTGTLLETLGSSGFGFERVSWYRDARILVRGSLRDLQETSVYQTGQIYVQGLSSMLPVLILGPRPGERLLDLTAAPGSKTTQAAALMENKGRITANDNHRVRSYKLKANLEAQGVSNTELSLRYGESFGKSHPEIFDRVLLDAPCSAEGRFHAGDSRTYGYWKPTKSREMAKKQRKLIASGLRALKPGGRLVYSTCTYAPEENESIVQTALDCFQGEVELVDIKFSAVNRVPGLSSWNGVTFSASIKKTMRLLPTERMEGFFVAAFHKKTS